MYKTLSKIVSIFILFVSISTHASDIKVTIWIHGTTGIPMIGDFVHKCPKPELYHVTQLPNHYRLKTLLHSLSQADASQFPKDHLYAFGWSGNLSFKAREIAAHNLKDALNRIKDLYLKHFNRLPEFTLLGHSHGVNVILNLAKILPEDFPCTMQAILMGGPVQDETKDLAKSPLFSQIYSLYSPSDWLQTMDPQGLYLTETNKHRHIEFSGRIFPESDNLKQAHIQVDGKSLWHLSYIMSWFAPFIPAIINSFKDLPSFVAPSQENVINLSTKVVTKVVNE